MSEQQPYTITISRLLGSGGSYLGARLASRLGIAYADREIVREAAKVFQLPEEVGDIFDEKCVPLWQSLLQRFEFGSIEAGYNPPLNPFPSDKEFHQAESDVVKSIADTQSAVILGRGGFYLLRGRKRHLSVFVHAHRDFRLKRIQESFDVSPAKAQNMMEVSDHSRYHYLRSLTHIDMTDARQFHLCLDTGALGLEAAEELIVQALKARLKEPLGQ